MINIRFFSLLFSFLFFAIYTVQELKETEVVTTKTELATFDNLDIQLILFEIKTLKRQQKGLIEYDKEHWNNYIESQKEKDKIIFPRTDYYCGDSMIGYKIYDICELEADEYKTLRKKIRER
jgi:hypothetical protein